MYLGLGVLLVLFAILMLCIGEQPLKIAKAVSEPVILVFATRSSEATLPLHMEKLVEMGVPKAVASVVLPLATPSTATAPSCILRWPWVFWRMPITFPWTPAPCFPSSW